MSTIRIVDYKSYFLAAGDETLNPSQPADLTKIAMHLCAPNAVRDLVDRRGLGGDSEAAVVMEFLRAMSLEQQAAVLSTPNAVLGLTYNGQAVAVVELVKAMPLEQQAAVLSAPGALRGLANNGLAAAVIHLLKVMRPEQQAAVLSTPGAARHLARNGQRVAVADIRQSLIPQVPCAPRSSADNFPDHPSP